MTLLKETMDKNEEKWRRDLARMVYANLKKDEQRVREPHKEYTSSVLDEKKEVTTMRVSCNGFTGELVKLERYQDEDYFDKYLDVYRISIYDSEKEATITISGVKLEGLKFLGGEVSFA